MKLSKSQAEEYIKDATNTMSDAEIWRDNVSKLRYIVNDDNNAKIFGEIENIFDQLLAPIQNVLDCFIIKNLLEVILKLIPFTTLNCCVDNIQSIHDKWNKFVDHPFGIIRFGPSQQICRICSQIIKTQTNRCC